MNKVIVTAGEGGAVIIQSTKNPDFGYIRVEQNRTAIGNDGWVDTKVLSALIRGTVKNLRLLGLTEGQELPGKVRVIEQLEPFNHANPEKDYKIAGQTGIVCTFEERPIFRNSFYSEDPNALDELVKHDNADAIKAKLASLKEGAEDKASL
jgi:hypothetical protein